MHPVEILSEALAKDYIDTENWDVDFADVPFDTVEKRTDYILNIIQI